MLKPVEETRQLQFALNLTWMLEGSVSIVPDLPSIYPLLSGIYASNLTANFDELFKFITMYPVGQRFTVGTLSQTGYAAIVDVIKAEDGFVYGIKYAPSEFTHHPALTFCLPLTQLAHLIAFLNGPYGTMNDIGSVPGIKWKRVHLNWWPPQEETISTPLNLVRQYAFAWPLGDRLRIGIIWQHGLHLARLKPNSQCVAILEEKDFLFRLIDELAVAHAQALAKKIAGIKRPTPPFADPVVGKAMEMLGELTRRLIARVD